MSYWTDKEVLLAGGAGLIGSYLSEILLDEGAYVTVHDDFSKGTIDNLQGSIKHPSGAFSYEEVDLRNPNSWKHVLQVNEPNIIVNLAAPSYGVGFSNKYHNSMLTETIQIGFNMIEQARQAGAKYVLVSSSCVYSDYAEVPTPEHCAFVGKPEKANEGYGWAKRTLELQTDYYRHQYGLDCLVVRPFNTYGPRVPVFEDSRDQVLISMICQSLKDDTLTLLGDGTQTRSFMHAKDVAKCIKLLTEIDGLKGPVNIGSNVEYSITELAKIIYSLSHPPGHKPEITYPEPHRLQGAPRKASDSAFFNYLVPLSRGPHVDLTGGLQELIEYVRNYLKEKNS
jgi:nucleoside-diphosphate-sugar epimerase